MIFLSALVTFAVVTLPNLTFAARGDPRVSSKETVSRLLKKADKVEANEIIGSPTDCSTFQYQIEISDELRVSYVVQPSEVFGSNATITMKLEYEGVGWLALGFARDAKGELKGSDIIVGEPNHPGILNPGKYHLITGNIDKDSVMVPERQTLQKGSITQYLGKTIMTFTKKLHEEGEIELKSDRFSTFIWAIGHGNALIDEEEPMDSGSFRLYLEACEVEATEFPIPGSGYTPEDSGPDSVSESTTDGIDPEFGAEPTVDDTGILDIPMFSQAGDCSQDYQTSLLLMPGLILSYSIRIGATDTDENSMSVMLEYDGEAWLGFGTADALGGKMMIGGEAIIGLPDEPHPRKYHLIGESKQGVFPMDDLQQTLSHARISQAGGRTVLKYTKHLREPGEIDIVAEGANTFIWAVGRSNSLNLHQHSGAIRLNVTPCLGKVGNLPSVASQDSEINIVTGFGFQRRQQMWLAHAICGVLAWAVLAPVAVGAAWFRELIKTRSSLWFKIHFYFNIAALVLTLIGFSLAVSLYNDSSEKHFVGSHQAVGLAMFLLVGFQAFCGIFRPSIVVDGAVRNSFDSSPESEDHNEKEEDNGAIFDHQPTLASQNAIAKNQIVRAAWKIGHRLIGLYLVVLGLWQVQSGIRLYAVKYEETDYSGTFLGYIALLGILLIVLSIYKKITEMQHEYVDLEGAPSLQQSQMMEINMLKTDSYPTQVTCRHDSVQDEESVLELGEEALASRRMASSTSFGCGSFGHKGVVDLVAVSRNNRNVHRNNRTVPSHTYGPNSLDGSLYIEDANAYPGGEDVDVMHDWSVMGDVCGEGFKDES